MTCRWTCVAGESRGRDSDRIADRGQVRRGGSEESAGAPDIGDAEWGPGDTGLSLGLRHDSGPAVWACDRAGSPKSTESLLQTLSAELS